MTAEPQIALDDEDGFRLARTENELLSIYQRALAVIPRHLLLPRHLEFVGWVCRMAPEHVSERQRDHIHRLAWVYRSRLPRLLAPKVDPDDPIVREQRHRASNMAATRQRAA